MKVYIVCLGTSILNDSNEIRSIYGVYSVKELAEAVKYKLNFHDELNFAFIKELEVEE